MNEFKNSPDGDATRFDRIVDGELSSDEYRRMLAELDDEPGGWRRCALAFLESQALAQELGALREERLESPDSSPSKRVSARRNFASMLLAMAASFLLAFGLGYLLRSPWQDTAPSPGTVAEESIKSPNEGVPTPRDSQFAGNDSTDVELRPTPQSSGPHGPLSNVTLVVGENEANARRFDLPVFYYGDVGDDFFQAEHSAMPQEMREMLQRSGHQLRRSQGFVPVDLEDGQRLVVPVEDVEIVPVSWPAL